MVLLPRDMKPWLRDMRLCTWLNPMVIVLCPRDMRPRSRDMRPQLRDMITWFRDMMSCMCAVHSWASMRRAAPGLVQRTTWPLTVGRNRLCESQNTKARQARMDEKCAPSSHTPFLPRSLATAAAAAAVDGCYCAFCSVLFCSILCWFLFEIFWVLVLFCFLFGFVFYFIYFFCFLCWVFFVSFCFSLGFFFFFFVFFLWCFFGGLLLLMLLLLLLQFPVFLSSSTWMLLYKSFVVVPLLLLLLPSCCCCCSVISRFLLVATS